MFSLRDLVWLGDIRVNTLYKGDKDYDDDNNNNNNNNNNAGACEYGDELSGSIKCGEFLD